MFKKLLIGAMVVLGIGVGIGQAVQQSTGTVVKVTCIAALSVGIDMSEYSFSNMAPGDVTIAATSATVINDSVGRIEDYTLDCTTWTANWNIDPNGTPGTDAFSLQALFKNAPPSAGEFVANDYLDDVTTAQNMDDPAFTVDSSAYDGDNITKNTQRLLWFRMHAPADTSSQSEQQMTVTVTAQASNTF